MRYTAAPFTPGAKAFFDLLDACNRAPADARESLEQQLWAKFGKERTVLVLDMAGFTTTVHKFGLLYFLRKIRYMQTTVSPLLTRWGGELVKFEADDCFAIFDRSVDAANCALAIHQTLGELTDGMPDVDNVVVSIGLSRGRILHIPETDLFGDAVNIASKLGEDVAGHGETLASAELFPDLRSDSGLKIEEMSVSISGVQILIGRLTPAP